MAEEVEIPFAKNLSKEEITDFLKYHLSKFKGFNSIKTDADTEIRIALFNTTDSGNLLIEINSTISMALNNYIEETFKESSKKYNRNIVFYESEARDKVLFLRW